METLFLLLGWGSPIGIGIFLVCLGGMKRANFSFYQSNFVPEVGSVFHISLGRSLGF